jgi:hypothetical protein
MKRLAIFLPFALFLLLPSSVAAAECQFVLGFKTLRDLIGHETVGECLEHEHYNHVGDGVQQTTGGLLVWRKADNWTAFTDGYRSWINGPFGLEQRLNTELFPWEVESVVESLPWVRDGLTYKEVRTVELLDSLGKNYSQVFWAVLESGFRWLPPQRESHLSALRTIVQMSAYSEVQARQIVKMPFLRNVDDFEEIALRRLSELLLNNPRSVPEIVANPTLNDHKTESDSLTILLLVLKAQDPEAFAKLESLEWVRSIITIAEFRSNFRSYVSTSELRLLEYLLEWPYLSRPTFMELMDLPWIQNGLTSREAQVLRELWELTRWDDAFTLELIPMPFLHQVDASESATLKTIGDLRWNEQVPGLVLSHPDLAGGITDANLGSVFLVVMDLMSPQVAAIVRALPWVQDGIDRHTELGSLQTLQLAMVGSPRIVQFVLGRAWAQDGLSMSEQEVISALLTIGRRHSDRREEEIALQIAGMPFLDHIDRVDSAAVRALGALHNWGGESHLKTVLSHPRLRNGIGDEESLVLSSLPPTIEDALELLNTHP